MARLRAVGLQLIARAEVESDAEAGSASAAGGRIRVGHLESRAAEGLYEIHRAAADEIQAHLVDNEGYTVLDRGEIVPFNSFGEAEAILEASAATAFDGKPENGGLSLPLGDCGDAGRRGRREGDVLNLAHLMERGGVPQTRKRSYWRVR